MKSKLSTRNHRFQISRLIGQPLVLTTLAVAIAILAIPGTARAEKAGPKPTLVQGWKACNYTVCDTIKSCTSVSPDQLIPHYGFICGNSIVESSCTNFNIAVNCQTTKDYSVCSLPPIMTTTTTKDTCG